MKILIQKDLWTRLTFFPVIDRNQGYYPVYCADGCTYGPAWYCNSGEWVGDKYDTCNGEPGCAHLGGGDFDVAHIHHGCSGSGVCKNGV